MPLMREAFDAFAELKYLVHIVVREAERAAHVQDEFRIRFVEKESCGDIEGNEFVIFMSSDAEEHLNRLGVDGASVSVGLE